MANTLPNLFLHKGKSWHSFLKDMKLTTNQLLADPNENEESGNVNLLPRKDINTYGICPKMEVFKLVQCNSCNKMLLPTVFKNHRDKFHSGTKIKLSGINTTHLTSSSSTSIAKKKENRNKEKKKKSSSIAPSLNSSATCLNAKTQKLLEHDQLPDLSASPLNVTIATTLSLVTTTTTKIKTTSSIFSSAPSSSSSSLSSSSVTLVSTNASSTACTTSGLSLSPISSVKAIVTKHKKTFQKNSKPSKVSDNGIQSAPPITEDIKGPCIKSWPSSYQQSPVKRGIETNSVSKFPLQNTLTTSSAVSSTSAKTRNSIFQIGTSILVGKAALSVPLTTQTVVFTIPCHMSSIKMYSCHPKPLSMPTPVTRRIGNSLILRNHHLEKQRNEIQIACRSKSNNTITSPSLYKTNSVLGMHHKPNILKSNSRGSNKTQGVKRNANDKSTTQEHKQIRLTTDLNGFILHSDNSESAETLQNNVCIQEKLTIFNMK